MNRPSTAPTAVGVAVLGVGMRLPRALTDLDALWALILSGTRVPLGLTANRATDFQGLPEPPAAFLDDVAGFDAGFFRLTPREAAAMDPQHRLLLECAHTALAHAGLTPERLQQGTTGVYVGLSFDDYAAFAAEDDGLAQLNGYRALAAGRLSYHLNLTGPSIQLDTTCASTLTAVSQACRALAAGDVRTALVGGVNVILSDRNTRGLRAMGVLSPDGRVKAFDAAADGYGRGEGCVVLVLQNLADARAAHRPLLGVIHGWADGHGGAAAGLTAPNPVTQKRLLAETLRRAGLVPADIGYVEAHGTGTVLGDAVEAEALHQVLADARPLPIGTIKTQIGHLEAAAGGAALVKALLVARHRRIPPLAGFDQKSPHLTTAPHLVCPRKPLPWPRDRGPYVVVHGLGISGSAACLIVGPPPRAPRRKKHVALHAEPLCLSAASPEALRAHLAACIETLTRAQGVPLAAFARTAHEDRAHHPWRVAVCTGSPQEAAEALRAAPFPTAPSPDRGDDLLFRFEGISAPQGRCSDLAAAFPAARRFLARCDRLAPTDLPIRPSEVLYGSPHPHPAVQRVARVAYQLLLARTARALGLHPEAVQGSGLGMIAAACEAGVLDLRTCLAFAADPARVPRCRRGSRALLDPDGVDVDDQVHDPAWWRQVLSRPANPPSEAYGTVLLLGEGSIPSDGATVSDALVVPLMPSRPPYLPSEALARLYRAGHPLSWEAWYQGRAVPYAPWPTYPFQHTPYRPRKILTAAPIQADYYQALHALQTRSGNPRGCADRNLSFAPLPTRRAGFSWVRFFTDPHLPKEAAAIGRDAQEEVRALLFDDLPWARITSVLDFGCGTGVDAVRLARAHPHVRVEAVNMDAGQCRLARDTVAEANLSDRITVHCRDSAHAPLPHGCGLAYGYQVAGHVPDKPALFANLAAALAPDGYLVLADFFAHTGFTIDHEATAAWLAPRHLPAQLCARHGLRLERVISAGAQVAHFLDDPDLEAQLATLPAGSPVAAMFRSFAGLQRLLVKDLAGFYLITARKCPGDHAAHNSRLMNRPQPYPTALALHRAARQAAEAHAAQSAPALPPGAIDTLHRIARGMAAAVPAHLEVPPASGPYLQRLRHIAAEGPTAANPRAEAHALLRDEPRLTAEVDLLMRVADHLPEVLQGRQSALDLLFPGGDTEAAFQFYRHSRSGAPAHALLGRVLSEALHALPPDIPRRLLEVGAGTGAATDVLRPALPSDWVYWFTDVSPAFVARASRALGPDPARTFACYDVGKKPPSDWPVEGFGVVAAANVLHATHALPDTLKHLHDLTAPGGVLLLLEGRPGCAWADVALGGLPGWWAYLGDGLRDHPLLPAETWAQVLRDAGFDPIRCLDPDPGGPLPQTVILAVRLPSADAPEARNTAPVPAWSDADLRTEIATQTAAVLGCRPADLHADRGFLEQGGDSLTALELRERLQRKLGTSLPATLLLDHPRPADLYRFLRTRLPDPSSRPIEEAPSTPRSCPPPPHVDTAIAVVGAACLFPGGVDHPDAFWSLLRAGKDAVMPCPPHRRTTPAAHLPEEGGYLRDPLGFDAAYFGIHATEAAAMDPRQGLLLEVVTQAWEDAGLVAERQPAAAAGLYVGLAGGYVAPEPARTSNSYSASGSAAATAAGRIAHFLGSHGPTMVVDTACSSALHAVHLACAGLRQGECPVAVAAAANLLHVPVVQPALPALGILSPRGRCRAFDATADGIARGEGCGAVVLQPANAARAQGRRILALIAGSAVNHDGTSAGLTAPTGPAQTALIREALHRAGLHPDQVAYLEAHGTGTPLGDAVELGALHAVFGERAHPLPIGSVKSQLGHLETAAGMAGLLKALLVLQHGYLPPQVNLDTPSPHIDPTGILQPVRGGRPLPVGEDPPVVGVSAFGFTGSNAHVLLRGVPREPLPRAPARRCLLLPLSAPDPAGLQRLARAWQPFLAALSPERLPHVCFTAAVGRAHKSCRMVLLGSRPADMAAALAAARAGQTHPGLITPTTRPPHSEDEAVVLARAYVLGEAVDWQAVYPPAAHRMQALPPYPFFHPAPPTTPPVAEHAPAPAPPDDTATSTHDAEAVARLLRGAVGDLLMIPADRVDLTASLDDLGADSLVLLSLRTRLNAALGTRLTTRSLFETYNRLGDLHAYLCARPAVPEQTGKASAPAPAPDPAPDRPAHLPAPEDSLTPRQEAHLAELIDAYCRHTAGSKERAAAAARLIADRRNRMGYRRALREMQYPLHVREATGCRITDVDGHTYIDLTMGFGTHYFGHNPAFIKEAVTARIEAGFCLGPHHEEVYETARLTAALTGAERVTFCTTGTEAVMTAVRLARAYRGRKRIAYFRHAYHGHFDAVLGYSDAPEQAARPMYPGVADEDALILDYGTRAALDVLTLAAPHLAAVLVEPVQTAQPDLAPRAFLHALRTLTEAADVPLIFDEIVTGLRSPGGSAAAYFGVRPDLICLGKALGGGWPLSVVAGRAAVMDGVDGGARRFGEDDPAGTTATFCGGTFSKNPPAMAAALAVLRRLEAEGDALRQTVIARADRFARTLNAWCEAENVPLHVARFAGFFRLVHPGSLDLLYYHLALEGVYIWEGRRCFLSTAHDDAALDAVVDAVKRVIGHLRKGGFLPPAATHRRLPLTPHQRQLCYLLETHAEAITAHQDVLCLRLPPRIDALRLEAALQAVTARHGLLRSSFLPREHTRRVYATVAVRLTVVDGTRPPAEWRDKVARARAATALALHHAPCFSLLLLRTADSHDLLLCTHQLAVDGASAWILLRELSAHYLGTPLPPAGAMAPPADPPDREPPRLLPAPQIAPRAVPAGVGPAARYAVPLPDALRRAVRARADDLRCRATHLHLAAFVCLLYRLSGSSRFGIGIPVSLRTPGRDDHLVGPCLTLLPIPCDLNGATSFAALVRHMGGVLAEALDTTTPGMGAPLARPEEPTAPSPLEVVFNEEEARGLDRLFNLPCTVVPAPIAAQLPLFSFHITHLDQGDLICVDYATRAFEPADIARITAYFLHLLEAAVKDPGLPPRHLPLTHPTPPPPPSLPAEAPPCLLALLARQVGTKAQAPVWARHGQRMSYAAFWARIHALATTFGKIGITAESLVGLPARAHPDTLVAWWALWWVGAYPLLLDPDLPDARREAVMRAAGCRRVWSPNRPTDAPASEQTTPPDHPLPPLPHPRQAAYAVATSGSSGTPKICVVDHGALRRYVQGATRAFVITPGLHYALVSPLWVDLGFCQLFLAAATGGCVHLFEGEPTRRAEALAAAFAQHPVDVLKITPAHLRALLAAPEGDRLLPRRILILGGEVPDPALTARIAKPAPGLRCYDGYGPAEACIETLVTPLTPAGPTRPLEGTAAYLLDTRGTPVPEGVTGECYLAGATLARGYAGAPGRTAEVFLPDPFAEAPGSRMYRTGDLAVRRGDRMQIRGRRDGAFKLRGFRIDPVEVEAALCTLPGVAEAAVTMVDGRLTALLVGRETDVADMRAAAAARLPEAWCPAAYVWCTALPLLASGKLDRGALPALVPTPEPAAVTSPRTKAEHTLAAIWATVLRIPLARIDIHRGFFHLGGDSLTAMDAVGRARSAGLFHGLADLVRTPTIAALAARSNTDRAPDPEAYDLLPMQAAFLARTPPARRHRCQMVLLLRLRPDTCLKRLEAAVDHLLARHPALRLRFDPDPRPTAHVRHSLPVVDLGRVPDQLTAHAAAVQERLDLRTGPLCRVVVYRRPGRPDCLLLRVHHLVADGVTLRFLLQDLSASYADPLKDTATPCATSGSWGAYARRLRTRRGAPPRNPPTTTGPTLQQEIQLTQAQTRNVRAALGPHFEAGLLQAFVGACARGTSTTVDLETHGRRADADMPDVVGVPGWFTAFVPLALRLPDDIQAQARPALQAAVTAAAARAHEVDDRAPLCFNYLGDFDPQLRQAPFAGLATVDPGPDHDPEAAPEHLLALHAWQHDGKLSLRLTADGAQTDPGQLQACLQTCRNRLLQTETPTLPPSAFQRALLTGTSRHHPNGCYVNRRTQILEGPLQAAAFAGAWQAASDAHSILRTAFDCDPAGHPRLQVRDAYRCPLTLIDCRDLGPDETAALQARFTGQKAALPVGPRPPWRLLLLRLTPTRHLWVWDHHHLLLDGWSTAALQVEVAQTYARLCRQDAPVPPTPKKTSDFRHYAAWEVNHPPETSDHDFMRRYLAGFNQTTSLPYDADPHLPLPTVPYEVRHDLGDVWPAVKAQASRLGVTPHTLVSAACALLLGEGTGTRDVVFGTVWSSRPPGMEDLMGPLIRTLPLRIRWTDEALGSWLRDLHQTAARVAELRLEPSALRGHAALPPDMPLFDLLLVTASYPHHDREPHYPGLKVQAAGWIEPTEYALVVVVVPGTRPILSLQADRRCLTPAACALAMQRLRHFLTALSAAEDTARVATLTAPCHPCPPDGSLPAPDVLSCLAAVVRRYPTAPAMSGERQLTYAALWDHMGGMARLLRRHGVGCDDVVVLGARRRDTALIAVGACWMVGAACIAPGPGVPASFEGAAFHITDETAYTPAPPSPAAVDARTAAYLIRTSGSTGNPKCVVLARGVPAALAAGMHARLPTPTGRCLQYAHPAFDVFYQELLWTWLGGGCLHVPPPAVYGDPIALLQTLTRASIDHAFLPTAVVRHLAAAVAEGAPPPRGLQTLVLAGEALILTPALRALCRACPDLMLHNHYGPAETHVVTTAATAARDLPDTAQMPIGHPLPGTAVYLLDASLHPVPRGAPGGLYVAGAQVGRGYTHQQAATAWAFLPDPFAGRPGARMYRTGDVARLMPDGQLMFLGRSDGACKIQGRRVDPLEIERVLLEDGAVHAAAVVPVDTQGARVLHAHVAMDPADPERLRRLLSARLPAFMQPRVLHLADTLPRTAGGKVDRARLNPAAAPKEAPLPEPVDTRITACFAKVLGTEVDARSDFFALGGHSLHAARLAFLLAREGFGHIPPRLVFQHPTPAALQRALIGTPLTPPAPDPAGLSFSQERLFVVHRHGAGEAFYHLSAAWRLAGVFSAALLEQAAAHVQARHALLDTVYHAPMGVPYRRRGARPPLVHTVALAHPTAERVASLLEAARNRRFNLHEGPVWRLLVVRTAPETQVVLCTVHHIAADAVSLNLLVADLAAAYAAAARGTPKHAPAPECPFDTFVALQRAQAAQADADRAAALWAHAPRHVVLPADKRATAMHGQGGTLSTHLEGAATFALRRTAKARGTTLFTVLHAAWACFIGTFAGTRTLAVAFARDGRDREAWADCFGCFTETSAVLHAWTDDTGFGDRVTALHAETCAAMDPRMPPFQVLGRLTRPPRDPLHQPLCTTAITWVDAPTPAPAFPGVATTVHPAPAGATRYDVELFAREQADGLALELLYRTDRFQDTHMRRLFDGFCAVLTTIGRHPDTPIARLHLPTPAARRQLLYALADGTSIPPFAQVPEPNPTVPDTAPALITEHRRTSYGALRRQTAVWAAALHARGIGPEDRVVVATAHTADFLAAMFAVWRAGATLVALDPHQPPAYRDSLLQAIRPKAVLDDTTRPAWHARTASAPPPNPSPSPQNLAYLSFTSGSSGTPKAVGTPYGALHGYLWDLVRTWDLGPDDTTALLSTRGFDAHLRETVAPLTVGACLLDGDRPRTRPRDLLCFFAAEGTRCLLAATPTTLRDLAAAVQDAPALPEVRLVLASGEVMDGDTVRAVTALCGPHATLVNLYGPTEATLTTSAARVSLRRPNPHLGSPRAGRRLYLLARGLPVPPGAVGTLFVAGPGLARGYEGRPGATAAVFVPDPGADEPGARCYDTGDLARLDGDCRLQFVGRGDRMVKLRGCRVEPAEIERVLRDLPDVAEAAVVPARAGNGEPALAAFVVARNDAGADREAAIRHTRAHLAAHLPSYMMPAAIMYRKALPRLANGKPDRRALEALAGSRMPAAETPSPETAAMEALWREVLNVPVGARDDFFALGGHSMTALRLSALIESRLDARMHPALLFAHPTPSGLVSALAVARPDTGPDPAPPDAVTPMQTAVLAADAGREDAAYHLALAFAWRGPLSVACLNTALETLCAGRPALHRTYRLVDGNGQAAPCPAAPRVRVIDVSAVRARRHPLMTRLIQARFHLATDPPLRVCLLRRDGRRARLLLVAHHVAVDAAGLYDLAATLLKHYAAALHGTPPPAEPAVHPAVFRPDEAALHEAVETLRDAPPYPTDGPRHTGKGWGTHHLTVDPALAAKVHALAGRMHTTPFCVLLTAFGQALARLTRRREVVVATPMRWAPVPTTGPAVDLRVLRVQATGDAANRLRRTHALVRAAQARPGVAFDALVRALNPIRVPHRMPLAAAHFSYHTPGPVPARPHPARLRPLPLPVVPPKYELSLVVQAGAHTFDAAVGYRLPWFDAADASKIAAYWLEALEQLVDDAVPDVADAPASPQPESPPKTADTASPHDLTRRLQELWTAVTGAPAAADTDFFALGGHSLSALALADAVHRETGFSVTPDMIPAYPTPAALARALHFFSKKMKKDTGQG